MLKIKWFETYQLRLNKWLDVWVQKRSIHQLYRFKQIPLNFQILSYSISFLALIRDGDDDDHGDGDGDNDGVGDGDR